MFARHADNENTTLLLTKEDTRRTTNQGYHKIAVIQGNESKEI